MNRRDLLLNEMGISQWVLTKPQVLKGDAQIRLNETVKLIVVCEEDYQSSRLFSDILLALGLQKSHYQWLNAEQSQRLVFTHSPIIWLIQAEEQAVKITKKFANSTAWQNHSWQDLTNSKHKRQLWQQMETYSNHLREDRD